jgi:hypothetical protein
MEIHQELLLSLNDYCDKDIVTNYTEGFLLECLAMMQDVDMEVKSYQCNVYEFDN